MVSDTQIVARTRDLIGHAPIAKRADIAQIRREMQKQRRDIQEITVWSVRQAEPLHCWTITLPGRVAQAVVSPHGERVAWLLDAPDVKRDSGPASAEITLWTSGLDGRGLREIGVIDFPQNSPYPEVNWSPDARMLSFTQGGALWVTAAT
ncbi:hypothetical protein CCAX7_56100 [Capsulimonas corticalis]|uniref:Uncharacterized protein n=1 Tax=Capsulimonas corticalis TaxID=2219043 RepID=A0A402D0K9_9BACT|nr:hypothetical protein CCAX7_56100 [Capsulimonas corticalis]